MADRNLNIFIRAKDQATGTLKKFTNFVSDRMVITLQDLTNVLRGVASAFTDAIDKANEQEEAVTKLNTALEASGQFTPQASKALQDYASELQRATTFGDEAILPVQQLLIQLGKLSVDEVPAATKAVIGLSAATGVDLKGAALAVAKTLSSTTNGLVRYGVTLDGTLPKQEKLNAIVEATAPLFAQAEAQAKTFAGRLQQISNAFGDQLEVIGFGLTKNQEFNDSLEQMLEVISDPEFVTGIADIAASLASMTASFVEFSAAFLSSGLGKQSVAVDETAQSFTSAATATDAASAATEINTTAVSDNTDAQLNNAGAVDAATAAQDRQLLTAGNLGAALGITFDKIKEDFATFLGLNREADEGFLEFAFNVGKAAFGLTTGFNVLGEVTDALDEKLDAVAESGVKVAAATEKMRVQEELSVIATQNLSAATRDLAKTQDLLEGATGSATDALAAAGDALGVQLDIVEKLVEQEKLKQLATSFTLLEKAQKEGLITSQDLSLAYDNLDKALRLGIIPNTEEAAEALDDAAKSTDALKGSVDSLGTEGVTDVNTLGESFTRLKGNIDGAVASADALAARSSGLASAQGVPLGAGATSGIRAVTAGTSFQAGTRIVKFKLPDGRSGTVAIRPGETFQSAMFRAFGVRV